MGETKQGPKNPLLAHPRFNLLIAHLVLILRRIGIDSTRKRMSSHQPVLSPPSALTLIQSPIKRIAFADLQVAEAKEKEFNPFDFIADQFKKLL